MSENAAPRNGLIVVASPSSRPVTQGRSERRRSAGEHHRHERQQPERAGQAVLRRVEHRAVHAVDTQAVVLPGGDRVDVGVPKLRERPAARQDVLDGDQALCARREDNQEHGRRRGHGAGAGRPREQIERRDQHRRGRDGVDLEIGFDVADGRRAEGRDCGRDQEVGPVIVQRLALHVRVPRRHDESPELGGQRHVPDEVGREVRAIVFRARLVGAAEIPVRRRHQQRHDQERGRQRRGVASGPRRQPQRRLGHPPGGDPEDRGLEDPCRGEGSPRHHLGFNQPPDDQARRRVADGEADDPASRMAAR